MKKNDPFVVFTQYVGFMVQHSTSFILETTIWVIVFPIGCFFCTVFLATT